MSKISENGVSVYYLSGIISFGIGCGKEGWPGIYTNVAAYYDWIVDVITNKNYKFS